MAGFKILVYVACACMVLQLALCQDVREFAPDGDEFDEGDPEGNDGSPDKDVNTDYQEGDMYLRGADDNDGMVPNDDDVDNDQELTGAQKAEIKAEMAVANNEREAASARLSFVAASIAYYRYQPACPTRYRYRKGWTFHGGMICYTYTYQRWAWCPYRYCCLKWNNCAYSFHYGYYHRCHLKWIRHYAPYRCYKIGQLKRYPSVYRRLLVWTPFCCDCYYYRRQWLSIKNFAAAPQ